MSSFKPTERAYYMQSCEEVPRGFLVTRCDGSKMLDYVEEPFDEIAFTIKYNFHSRRTVRFDFGGITTSMRRAVRLLMRLSASYPLSARRAPGSTCTASAPASLMS